MRALTHPPTARFVDAIRSGDHHGAIDLELARAQHVKYRDALVQMGAEVEVLAISSDAPDAVFVEDTTVVLDEVALICAMGHPSRRAEATAMEPVVARWRAVERIALPATIDGGDVLRVGRALLVGLSTRTNPAAVNALREVGQRFGYEVIPVPVRTCLHLKTACTALPDGTLLLHSDWLDLAPLASFARCEVARGEPRAANVVVIGEAVCMPAGYPETAEIIRRRGFAVYEVALSEFAKADGSATCLSVLVP